MSIKYLSRKDINVLKYNDCIENSEQSLLYGYSWYLDIVCDHWDVVVLNDYKAVMPIPWRKKYGIKYVYQPLWVLQLGVFSTIKNFDESVFFDEVINHYKFVELRLNTNNNIVKRTSKSRVNQLQYLSLENSYQAILKSFNRNRKRELKKASNALLVEKWGDLPQNLIKLFEENIGVRIKNINKKDYQRLLNLLTILISKGNGEVLSIYDNNENLVASGFFIIHKTIVTELVCATDFNNRDHGANTFLIDRALYKYHHKYTLFDFGGSSIKSIANYYKSFGANTAQYLFYKINTLPFFMRIFKP